MTHRACCQRRGAALSTMLLAVLLVTGSASAQGVLGVDPTGRSGDAPPLLPRERPASPEAPPALPPLPEPPAKKTERLPQPQVFVRGIKITGSMIFSPQELAQVTAPYTNRDVTSEDLEELRLALTRLYVDKGYVTSGAILPDQTVTDGVITFHIVEGALSRIEVDGNRWLRTGYIEQRLALGTDPPLNRDALAERMQLLREYGNIDRLNATLRPGVRLGESILNVQVEEQHPYSLLFGFNNYQSPTVGAERGLASLVWRSLTGYGDPLSVTYGQSSGVVPQLDASYAFPLTARDTTVTLRYRKNDFGVVEAPFDDLDVESESEIYGVTVRHPLMRTLHREVALSLAGEHLRNKTFLLGIPFSFSAGARKGKSVVSALRFALEWTERMQGQVIATRSQFSVGVDVLGATNNRSGIADSQFFSWLGQFQWVRRWGIRDIQTIARVDAQLTNDPLLSLEQIAVGGRYSVRGYRENQLVRDTGFIGSLEARVPLLREATFWATTLELAPFVDVGRAWNAEGPGAHPETIASVGIGLRWAMTVRSELSPTHPLAFTPQLEVYWGHPLHDVPTSGGNLQDEGVHVQLLVAMF